MQSVALRAPRVGVSRNVARPARRSAPQSHTGRFARLVVFSTVPEVQKKLEEALKTAEETCGGDKPATPECAVAWDEVEELAAAASHKKVQEKVDSVDPLEQFCEGNPDADECRVYED